jgi:hypothetical protein
MRGAASVTADRAALFLGGGSFFSKIFPAGIKRQLRLYTAAGSGEIAATGDRQNNRQLSHIVKFVRRHYQNRTCSPLFVPFSRIKRDKVNIAAPHQTSSIPL